MTSLENSAVLTLHVIGLGVAEQAHLDTTARCALRSAELVFGSPRQLDTVQAIVEPTQRCEVLPKLNMLAERLTQLSRTESGLSSVVILASGDPLFYGIGKWLRQLELACELNFYPAVSSIQAACHRAQWALQDVEVLSLHGRPLAKLRALLRPGHKLAILSDAQSTPALIAQECVTAGYEYSQLMICETLGYATERLRRFQAAELALAMNSDTAPQFDPLHVTLLEVASVCRPPAQALPDFPGLADQMFVTDKGAGQGMMTKREVRLQILSYLRPHAGDIVWDVGAGCGSVSIELALWNVNKPGSDAGQVYAIEHHPERLQCLEANRQKFGLVSALSIIADRAEHVLDDLPDPAKIFIGGSGGELAVLLQRCWARLPGGGILVASAVTETSKQLLLAFYQERLQQDDAEAETVQLANSRGEMLAGQLMYRPQLAVNVYAWRKI